MYTPKEQVANLYLIGLLNTFINIPVKPYDVVLCPINVGMSVRADEGSMLSFLNIKTPGI